MGALKIWDGTAWQTITQEGPAGPMQGAHASTHYTGGTDPITGRLPLKVGAGNVIAGQGAAAALTTGDYNVAIGVNALNLDTTGTGNVAVGYLAGHTGSGDNNTAIGNQADALSGTSARGTAIGASALAATNAASLGYGANALYPGSVAIGIDSAGSGVTSYSNDSITLGTTRHIVHVAGQVIANNGLAWYGLNFQYGIVNSTTNGTGDWNLVIGTSFASTALMLIPVDAAGNHFVHSVTSLQPWGAVIRTTQVMAGVWPNGAVTVRYFAIGPK
jgi:hypothetical protein